MVVALPGLTTAKRIDALRGLIGNTPLLEIAFRYEGSVRRVFAKAEYLNFSGSIKDRMVLHILQSAYDSGRLQAGDPIAEATSGCTGIALAAIGRVLGHPVTIYMPDWMSRERVQIIRGYGGEVVLVSRAEGGFRECVRRTLELRARNRRVFLPDQFGNPADVEAHEVGTAPEILRQLAGAGLKLDAFAAGVGTGGTVMGMARWLLAARKRLTTKVHPLEPAESPTLSTGRSTGSHRIQGLLGEFIPDIVKLDELDEPIAVSDGDAILMAQKLAAQLGLSVGISSGCNFLGAVLAQSRLGRDAVAATVFPDDGRKYLSTDLVKEEPVKREYVSPRVELLEFSLIRG